MSAVELDVTTSPVPRLTRFDGPIGGRCILYGYSIAETTGTTPASLYLYNSANGANGPVIPITLSAGQSTEDWFGPQGIEFDNGVYPIITGTMVGSLFVALAD